MIIKTHGIVLNYIKYGDTSIIVKVFSEQQGFGSYIVNGVRSQRSKKSIGYFQPFSILELVLYVKESRDLQRISDFRNHLTLYQIHQNFTKGAITLFLTEVLTKLLQSEPAPNPELYHFLASSIATFDQLQTGVENFHIQLLMKVAAYLGFAIDEFEVLFTSIDQLVPHAEDDHLWKQLIEDPYGCSLKLNREARNQIIDVLLGYYHHHANLAKPKSLEVLRSVLN